MKKGATGSVVRWLMEKAAVTLEDVARETRIDLEKIRQLIDGQKKATQQDIYQLAQFFKISPAIIALGQIPDRYELEKYVHDFRGKKGSKLSRNARALALHLFRTIDVYRSAFRTSRKEFVGQFQNQYQSAVKTGLSSPDLVYEIIDAIQVLLNLPQLQEKAQNTTDFYHRLLYRLENLGVNVVESSIVGTKTRWKIPVQDFEGLAIADPYLPTIFIHTGIAVTKGRRIFTLVHEFAHLLTGNSAIDYPSFSMEAAHEDFFNRVTSEALMPKEKFSHYWEEFSKNSSNADETVNKLHQVFKTSIEAIYYRSYKMGYISLRQYKLARAKALEKTHKRKEGTKNTGGGPSFWDLLPARFGRLYVHTILQAVQDRRISIHEGAEYMGIHTITLYRYLEKLRSEQAIT